MAKEIKYGMVGGSIYAFIGEVHRKALAFDPRAELVAGCFSNIESENIDTANAYGVSKERTYRDYKEMAAAEAARPDKIDFVSICTPNFLHYEVAKEFLLAGINVVCEKPLCFAVEEAEELERIAAEKHLIFAVTYAYTGYVMPKVMKEMIANGRIGKIATVVAEYAQDWLVDELSPEKQGQAKNLSVWRTDPKFSGVSNCVGDIGTHVENMVHYLTGFEIKRLMAVTDCFGHALDLNANIIVEYENGVRGQYWCSQIATGRMNGLVGPMLRGAKFVDQVKAISEKWFGFGKTKKALLAEAAEGGTVEGEAALGGDDAVSEAEQAAENAVEEVLDGKASPEAAAEEIEKNGEDKPE